MKRFLTLAFLLLASAMAFAQEDTLYEHFLNPEKSYRPRTWWHWMNGNITADGVRKDLEWMDRADSGTTAYVIPGNIATNVIKRI